jgi:hypothetical protein
MRRTVIIHRRQRRGQMGDQTQTVRFVGQINGTTWNADEMNTDMRNTLEAYGWGVRLVDFRPIGGALSAIVSFTIELEDDCSGYYQYDFWRSLAGNIVDMIRGQEWVSPTTPVTCYFDRVSGCQAPPVPQPVPTPTPAQTPPGYTPGSPYDGGNLATVTVHTGNNAGAVPPPPADKFDWSAWLYKNAAMAAVAGVVLVAVLAQRD